MYIGVTITNRVIENLVLSTCLVYFLSMHGVHHLVNTELESPTFKVSLARPALPKNGEPAVCLRPDLYKTSFAPTFFLIWNISINLPWHQQMKIHANITNRGISAGTGICFTASYLVFSLSFLCFLAFCTHYIHLYNLYFWFTHYLFLLAVRVSVYTLFWNCSIL